VVSGAGRRGGKGFSGSQIRHATRLSKTKTLVPLVTNVKTPRDGDEGIPNKRDEVTPSWR